MWLQPARLVWTARAGLVACAILTAAFAFAPPRDGLHLTPWDKADHFCAFFALMSAAVMSFPRQSLVRIALALSIAGAVIEVVQGLPWVHRDSDVWDWAVENLAIAAVVGLLVIAHLRRQLRGGAGLETDGI